MSLCSRPDENEIVFVTRLHRVDPPSHYVFIGSHDLKKNREIFDRISAGSLRKDDEKKLSNISKKMIGLIKTILKKNESITFIPDRIWFDDTVHQIKIKIFVYLSSLRDRKFLLPPNQQLWTIVGKEDVVLGSEFIKQVELPNGQKTFSYPMSYPPVLDSDKVEIDDEFLTAGDERTSDIQVINRESDILYDILSERGEDRGVQRIFLYMLEDELEWYDDTVSKRVWNGYFLKHWPFADSKVDLPQVVKFFKDAELRMKAQEKVIDSVREEKLDDPPRLDKCVAWQLILWSRLLVKKDERPFRLDMAYAFLRNQLSEDIPFIYYTSTKEKRPFISVHQPSVDSGALSSSRLRDWVFVRGSGGHLIPSQKRGIQLKVFLYRGEKHSKYETVILNPNGDVGVSITFDESKQANLDDIQEAIQKVTNLITLLNTDFLEKQGLPLFPVPELKIIDKNFVLGETTHIQYFNVITSFQYTKELSFHDLMKFSRNYTPFAEPSILSLDKPEDEEMTEVVLKYRRVSRSSDLPVIFEFINKDRLEGASPEATVESIVRRFGKSRQEANEAYRQYRIMKEDPQSAKRLIRELGINITFKRAENFLEKVKGKTNYNYKVFISGLSSQFILRNCYQFIEHLVNSYYHPKMAPEKKASQALIESGIEFDFGYVNNNVASEDVATNALAVNQREPVSNEEELVLSNIDITNINLEKQPEKKQKEVDQLVKRKADFSSTGDIDITDESKADPTVRLRCPTEEDKIVSKGTCKNVCDDMRFKLRRLQQFEPRIFHFPHLRGKNQPYSRQCDDPRRPIVMAYDPATNPKINKDAFTYSIKYRTSEDAPYRYYICPQAWCPTCEIPIPVSKLKTIKTVRTKKGECKFGICPNGDHQVYINQKGMENVYPGFIDPGGNPEGFCMPCCFKIFSKNTTTYRRCTREDDVEEINDDQGWRYINRSDKIPLQEGRFGLLTAEVEAFIGQSGCKNGTLKQGFDCLVRKGVKPSPDRSFVYAIADLLSGIMRSKINEKEMRKRLINKITPQLFASLNSGRVKRIFGTIDEYKKYLRRDEGPFPETYLWDLVSRPGIFTKEGFNLIIFTPHSIYCPRGQDPKELYSSSKPTALFIKFEKIYEPIYRIDNRNNQPIIQVLHSTVNPMIHKILEFARKGCASYNEIDWEKAGNIKKTKEMKLNDVVKELNKLKNPRFRPKLQLTDSYSKTTALIVDDNYLPVKPSRIREDIPFANATDTLKFKPNSLDKVMKFLGEIEGKTKIPVVPTHLVLDGRNELVVGVLLETQRIVPIRSIRLKEAKKLGKLTESEMLYYPESNRLISRYDPSMMTPEIEQRLRAINEYRYKNEAFERYKFEFGRYLQEPSMKKVKVELEALLEAPDKNLAKIKTIVKKIDGEITSSVADGVKKLNTILNESKTLYRTPLLRKPCFSHKKKEECIQDPHCVKVNNQCRLANLPNTNFQERLTDLLRRYPFQKAEIMDGRVPITDPLKTLKQEEAEEVLLSGNKIDAQFQKLIAKEKGTVFLESFPDIDIAQPSFEGVDKQKYLIVSPDKEAEIQTYSLANQTQHWSSQLGPWYRLVSPMKACQSLYYCFAQLANILKDVKTEDTDDNKFEEETFQRPDPASITGTNIQEIYAHFLLQVPPEKVREVARQELRIPDKEEIEKMVDVSDFYNKFQNEDRVDSVDDLVERIVQKTSVYRPSTFDVIWMSLMLDIKIILLRKSISELIGQGDDSNSLFGVFFYEPTPSLDEFQEDECIRFYLLQKSGVTVLSGLDSTIRKLLPSTT